MVNVHRYLFSYRLHNPPALLYSSITYPAKSRVSVIHKHACKSLYEHDIIIMSGYGWNDRGANGRILEWLGSSPDKKLYLLHEDPEEIRDKSQSPMWHRFDEEVRDGRLILVRKYLQDATLADLSFFEGKGKVKHGT